MSNMDSTVKTTPIADLQTPEIEDLDQCAELKYVYMNISMCVCMCICACMYVYIDVIPTCSRTTTMGNMYLSVCSFAYPSHMS